MTESPDAEPFAHRTVPKAVRAGDVKCALCGEGWRDVDPEYPLGPDPQSLSSPSSATIYAHCKNGHAAFVEWRVEDGRVVVDNVPWPLGGAKAPEYGRALVLPETATEPTK